MIRTVQEMIPAVQIISCDVCGTEINTVEKIDSEHYIGIFEHHPTPYPPHVRISHVCSNCAKPFRDLLSKDNRA